MTIDQPDGARNLFHFGRQAEASGWSKLWVAQAFSDAEETSPGSWLAHDATAR